MARAGREMGRDLLGQGGADRSGDAAAPVPELLEGEVGSHGDRIDGAAGNSSRTVWKIGNRER
ncbi:hypothetical protein NN6n1_32290 [Shinella zoogloeoides]